MAVSCGVGMTKNGLFAVSLIGAIPGAFLAYLCVMAFLNFAGGSSILLKGLTGLLLLIGAGMPILSAATLLQGREAKGAGEAPADKAKGKAKAAAVEVDEAEEAVAVADSDELLDADEVVDDEIVDDVLDEDEPPAKSKKKRK